MKPEKALKIIAEREGVSLAHVRKEIQKAIDEAMKSTDPNVLANWKKIPCKGKKPTPEEVISYYAKKIK